ARKNEPNDPACLTLAHPGKTNPTSRSVANGVAAPRRKKEPKGQRGSWARQDGSRRGVTPVGRVGINESSCPSDGAPDPMKRAYGPSLSYLPHIASFNVFSTPIRLPEGDFQSNPRDVGAPTLDGGVGKNEPKGPDLLSATHDQRPTGDGPSSISSRD